MQSTDTTTAMVQLTVTETVVYDFPVSVEIPASLADDPEELAAYLADDESGWLDELPIDGSKGYLAVTPRSVDKARILATQSGK
jgi:hypothetical protein